MDLIILIFWITASSEFLLGGSLIFTLLIPRLRIWPPPSKNSWQFWYTWILTAISYLGIIVISIFDWNSFILDHWSHFLIGIVFIIIGVIFISWSIKTLSTHATLGFKGKLVISGPYKYSRNPQYISDIFIIIGIIILSNSLFSFITGLLGIFLFISVPFIEEPWLKKQFKEEYEDYCKKVSRFLFVI